MLVRHRHDEESCADARVFVNVVRHWQGEKTSETDLEKEKSKRTYRVNMSKTNLLHVIFYMESLILAQDERCRHA